MIDAKEYFNKHFYSMMNSDLRQVFDKVREEIAKKRGIKEFEVRYALDEALIDFCHKYGQSFDKRPSINQPTEFVTPPANPAPE